MASGTLEQLKTSIPDMVDMATQLVRTPSVSGTDGENEAQAHMAALFADGGLDVDHWRLDLDALTADADFPGMEVERREAWGLVGRLPGTGDGPTLMLNGHIDVVPTGDPDGVVGRPVPAARSATGDSSAAAPCDMKAGLVAAHWARAGDPSERACACAATCWSRRCRARRTAGSARSPRCSAAGAPTPA